MERLPCDLHVPSQHPQPVQGWVVVLITQVIDVGQVITLSKVLILLFLLGLNSRLYIVARVGAAGQ